MTDFSTKSRVAAAFAPVVLTLASLFTAAQNSDKIWPDQPNRPVPVRLPDYELGMLQACRALAPVLDQLAESIAPGTSEAKEAAATLRKIETSIRDLSNYNDDRGLSLYAAVRELASGLEGNLPPTGQPPVSALKQAAIDALGQMYRDGQTQDPVK
ncbi:MAG: hypothetical protein ACK5GN_07825 [Pseudomonadota bacterium]|jgi:hypothetical protein